MPPRVPHGPHGWEDNSLSMLPFVGSFLFLLLILGLAFTAFYLWRSGKLPMPNLGNSGSPEEDAKRVLAERLLAETSAPMSSWSGPAFSTGLPVRSQFRLGRARAVAELRSHSVS